MKKSVLGVIGMTLAGFTLLVGCGGGTTGTTANKQTPVTVDIDEPTWTNDLKTMSTNLDKKFHEQLNVVQYSDTTSYQSSLRPALGTSKAPGMFKWWSGQYMTPLIKAGELADLTDIWKQYEKDGLNPNLAQAFSYNGKIYGIPMTANYWVVFYNKKVFDKYGLSVPSTWSQFLDVSAKLKANGVTPFGDSITDRWPGFIWFEDLLTKYDPTLYDNLMVGKASYTDPGVVNVMKIWKSFYDKGYFAPPVDWRTELPKEFATGKVGMVLWGDWYQPSLAQAGMKPGSDYGSFILPAIQESAGKTVIFETAPLLVSEHSSQKQEALKVASHIMDKDIIGPWTTSKQIAPLVPGTPVDNPVTKKIVSDIASYKLEQRFWEATPPDISEYAVDQFDKFMLHPDQYMDVLQNIQKFADQYWKNNK